MKSINKTVSKLNIIMLIANISVLVAVQFFFTGRHQDEKVNHEPGGDRSLSRDQ